MGKEFNQNFEKEFAGMMLQENVRDVAKDVPQLVKYKVGRGIAGKSVSGLLHDLGHIVDVPDGHDAGNLLVVIPLQGSTDLKVLAPNPEKQQEPLLLEDSAKRLQLGYRESMEEKLTAMGYEVALSADDPCDTEALFPIVEKTKDYVSNILLEKFQDESKYFQDQRRNRDRENGYPEAK